MAAQNSILWWSSSHRVHHKYVDNDWDPYNIKRGFWWAHILWIFYQNDQRDDTFANAPDLLKNPVVMWQNRWHKVILIVGGFGMPTLIGAAFGDPIAGLLWGGFLRIVVIHHTTFFVNSLAHYARQAAVQRRGLGARQLARGAAHARRGLPQLPSPLPGRLPQRHPLVSLGSGEVVHRLAEVRSAWPRDCVQPRRCRRSSRRACAQRCRMWSS